MRWYSNHLKVVIRKPSTITFIADISKSPVHSESIKSIIDIGNETGIPFKIITPPPVQGESKDLEAYIGREIVYLPNLGTSNGEWKVKAAILGGGRVLAMFDPGKEYPLPYADLIHSYLEMDENIVLVSSILMVPSYILRRIGYWRFLYAGEDIDLLSRASKITNLIVFNPPGEYVDLPASLPDLLNDGYIPWKPRTLVSYLRRQRDQLIAYNYSLRDLRIFSTIVQKKSLPRLILSLLTYGSSLFRRKRSADTRSNYNIVMDSLLSSVILTDYKRLEGFSHKPSLRLRREDVEYLSRFNSLWRTLSKFVNVDLL